MVRFNEMKYSGLNNRTHWVSAWKLTSTYLLGTWGGQEYVIGVGGEGNVMRHSETVLEVPPDGGVGCLGL